MIRDEGVVKAKAFEYIVKKELGNSSYIKVLEQGVKITPFVRLWSTMTMIESKPEDGRRSVMRSTESCLKGRAMVDGMGQRGGVVGWVLTLFC